VTVTLEPLSPKIAPGEGVRLSAGAWAANAQELDKYLEWNRQQRKASRTESWECTMIELTPQQHEVLAQNGTESARAIDRATNVEYVLIRAEVYERLRALLSDDMPDAGPLMNEVMAADDANDPYLDSLQSLLEPSRQSIAAGKGMKPDAFWKAVAQRAWPAPHSLIQML